MAIWGAVIAGAASIASTLIAQAAAKKKQKQREEEMKQYGQFVEDSKNENKLRLTEMSEYLPYANALYDSIRSRNEVASNPVSNYTPEEQANVRAQGAKDIQTYGQTVTSATMGENARIDNQYQTSVANVANMKMNNLSQQSQQIANAGSQAANTFANVAGSFVNTRASGSGNSGDTSVKSDATSVKTRAVSNANEDKTAEENKAVVNDLVGGQVTALGSYDPDEGDYAPFKSMFGN